MVVPVIVSDAAACPSCSSSVRPFEVVESIPKASGLVIDQGVTVRRRYQHCDQTWERTVHRPPRWSSSSPGQGR